MEDYSVLIGGKAGYGIDKASLVIAGIFNRLGWRIYVYRDYPSLIRGGHTFSIIRACRQKVSAHSDKVDCILALDQNTVECHKHRLKGASLIIYDSDSVKSEGIGLPLGNIIKEEGGSDIMRNTCMIGAMCRAIGAGQEALKGAVMKYFAAESGINIKIALRGYGAAIEHIKLADTAQGPMPILTGNEAIALGLARGGLEAYIAYPMTPVSPILHYLAQSSQRLGLTVIHPESEIAVMLMALGFSYAGRRSAVGTSGGGFCLMTEGLSFAGMAELPIVVVLGQRPGPSTGLPTYSCQTELNFAINAGQGEFPRFVVAPGDPEEAYYWSRAALDIAWKYQIPSIILSDKTLGEGAYSFDIGLVKDGGAEGPALWDRGSAYKRYMNCGSSVSHLAFPGDKDAIVKINSYEHDETGISTEDAGMAQAMQDKRLGKERLLIGELEMMETVKIHGDRNSATALLCWGSNKGVCVEAAQILGLRVIQPVALWPFPVKPFKGALSGVNRLIAVENNSTGQLVSLIKGYGFDVDFKVLKYDGRPFSLDGLMEKLKEIVT